MFGGGGRVNSGLVHVMNAYRLSLFFFPALLLLCIILNTNGTENRVGLGTRPRLHIISVNMGVYNVLCAVRYA